MQDKIQQMHVKVMADKVSIESKTLQPNVRWVEKGRYQVTLGKKVAIAFEGDATECYTYLMGVYHAVLADKYRV